MNNKLALVLMGTLLSALVYTSCKKSSSDDSTTPTTTATCSDGIQNQSETGVDCGGPCSTVCPTCTDGIKNGTETDIDCGGTCPACIPSSLTATISGGTGSFVADPTTCYVDSSISSGITTYKVYGTSGGASTLRFDLQVKFTGATAIATNVAYTPGNISGVITTLSFIEYVGPTPYNYNAAPGNGQIKFTAINFVTHRASGTFNFIGTNGATTRTITSGVFTNFKLQ